MAFVNAPVSLQIEEAVHPVGNSGQAAVAVDGNGGGTPEDRIRIKDIVNLLILQQAVRMDARTGNVEVAADKGGARRDTVADIML